MTFVIKRVNRWSKPIVQTRNATTAVIGAGDYIGAAIAKKFASEGFTVFAGRRRGEKLAPLVAEVEAAGGRITGRSVDARKEDDLAAFLRDADAADDAVAEAGASDGADVSDGDGRGGGAGVFATTGGAGGRENRTRASRACGGLSRRSVG